MSDLSVITEKLALVKWLNGVDEGRMSIVSTSWLRNYVHGDESNIVEWREGKKPAMGWRLFDANVIKLSNSESALEKLLGKLAVSTYKANSTLHLASSSGAGNSSRSAPVVLPEKKGEKKKQKEREESEEQISSEAPTSLDDIKEMQKCQQASLQSLEESCKRIEEKVDKLYRVAKRHKSLQPEEEHSSSEMVEIFQGTNVCVTATAWEQRTRLSTTAFVRLLIGHLFTPDILLRSNLGGGESKNTTGGERHMKLDAQIVEAIFAAAIKLNPRLSRGEFGRAVNGVCNDARAALKKRTKR